MTDEDKLRSLCADALNELLTWFHSNDEDDQDYVDSLFERARELGVSV